MAAEDWPQFRGPLGRGISSETSVPTQWSKEKNVRWRTELLGPGNCSSPIVSKDRVFVVLVTDQGKKRALVCLDRSTGKELWTREVAFEGDEPTYENRIWGGATPAADGERVVVWHSSAGMHCYDYDGQPLWSADLGPFIHIWGYGASPILYKDLVIHNCGPGERTFLVALNKYDGKEVWRTDEPGGHSGISSEPGKRAPWIGSWSTPQICQADGQEQILVSYPHHVKAYDPQTGKVIWQCDGLGDLVYTSALVGDGFGVAMGGFHGPAIGFKLGGQGNVTEQNRLWRHDQRNPQRIGSGVIVGQHLFMVNENGVAQCLDPLTGKELWTERLPESGTLWGSLTYAAGNLYVTTKRCDTIVFKANPEKLEPVAVNSLGEPTDSTMAISGGQIFLRTFNAVYCIEEQQ
jgi:outer membrane protein assembly factor BamB